jgi:flagellar hook protein FlgE
MTGLEMREEREHTHMTQGLFVAASGIRNNQLAIDVVSNNIANINTTAFKSSKANFANTFLRTLTSGSRPSSVVGGTNPMQVGSGVTVNEIATNHSQGGTQFTGRSSDLLVNGEGYFVVDKLDTQSTGNSGTFFTRAGNFSMDANGNLVTAQGNRLRGTSQITGSSPINENNVNVPMKMKVAKYFDASDNLIGTSIGQYATPNIEFDNYATANAITPTITTYQDVELVNFSVGVSGGIVANYSNGDRLSVRSNPDTTQNRTEMIHLTDEGKLFAAVNNTNADGNFGQLSGAYQIIEDNGNGGNPMEGMSLQLQTATVRNKNGLEAIADNGYIAAPNAGDISFGIPGSGNRGQLQGASLETSNVDMAAEFSNLVISQRGLEANSRIIRAQSEVMQSIIQAF